MVLTEYDKNEVINWYSRLLTFDKRIYIIYSDTLKKLRDFNALCMMNTGAKRNNKKLKVANKSIIESAYANLVLYGIKESDYNKFVEHYVKMCSFNKDKLEFLESIDKDKIINSIEP